MDLSRHENENERQYLRRVGKYVDEGKCSWKEITPTINKLWRENEEEYRDESAYRKPRASAKAYYEDVFSHMIDGEYLNEIKLQTKELTKERMKLQTEKLEYNRWLREEARDELILEKIVAAIKSTQYPDMPMPITDTHNHNRTGILMFGDEHFGKMFQIKGLTGEIINEYNPEIFENRMWRLFDEVINIVRKENLEDISVYSLGDFTDGILRVSQLFTLKYGVVEGSVLYAKFIISWLNRLSSHVKIRFQMVRGNHSELRLLGQPKGTFQNENMDLVVREMIKTYLANNKNFEFIENPTGLIYENIYGKNILGIHGEVKNMRNALNDFSNIYHINIDYLIGGHLHHKAMEEVAIDKEVITVPSIIGVDDYSMSIRKTANSGAKFIIFEKDYGIKVDYPIKLN